MEKSYFFFGLENWKLTGKMAYTLPSIQAVESVRQGT